MTIIGIRQLAAAVKFTTRLPFVNPSRASPDFVVYEGGKISFSGDNTKGGKNAVFLTTGLIVESHLKTPTDSTINLGYKVRCSRLFDIVSYVQCDRIRYNKLSYSHSPARFNDFLLTSERYLGLKIIFAYWSRGV